MKVGKKCAILSPIRNNARIMQQSDSQLVHRLEAHGILPTSQRLEIARVLLAEPQHVSADQLLAMVLAAGGRVSKATVYNTLKLFSERGLVREVHVDPERVFYDSTTRPHHHLFNMDTGEITDIDPEEVAFSRLPDVPEGMEPAGVEVVLRVRGKH